MATGKELSLQGDKYLGTPYEEMDCQAFWERCLKDVGINKDLAGSNTWIREMLAHGWVGTPEECKAKFGSIPLGAALYIVEQDGKEPEKYRGDGVGNASHIGMYIGREDGAIHSSKSRGGVAYSAFRGKSINGGWNRVGLWDRIDYNTGGGGGETMTVTISGGNPDTTINMRSGPSRKEPIIADIPQGSSAELLSEDGDWDKIKYSGKTGYVMSKFVHKGSTPTPPEPSGDTVAVDKAELVAMRDQIDKWLNRG